VQGEYAVHDCPANNQDMDLIHDTELVESTYDHTKDTLMKSVKWPHVLVVFGLPLIAFGVMAHPDSPLEFRKHMTKDGRIIYSNIYKKCFSEGLLTCHHLHPVIGVSVDDDDKAVEADSSREEGKLILKLNQVAE